MQPGLHCKNKKEFKLCICNILNMLIRTKFLQILTQRKVAKNQIKMKPTTKVFSLQVKDISKKAGK